MTQEKRERIMDELEEVENALEDLRDALKSLESLGYQFELTSEQADNDRLTAKAELERLQEDSSEFMRTHYNGDRIAYECALRGVSRWGD